MSKKPKEPSFWSTSANGQTRSGGSWGHNKKKNSGCPLLMVAVTALVLAVRGWMK